MYREYIEEKVRFALIQFLNYFHSLNFFLSLFSKERILNNPVPWWCESELFILTRMHRKFAVFFRERESGFRVTWMVSVYPATHSKQPHSRQRRLYTHSKPVLSRICNLCSTHNNRTKKKSSKHIQCSLLVLLELLFVYIVLSVEQKSVDQSPFDYTRRVSKRCYKMYTK